MAKQAEVQGPMTEDEKRLDAVFKAIEKLHKDHDLGETVVIFKPRNMKTIDKPLLFFLNDNNNHHYEAAVMMAEAMRNLKGKIVSDLDC